MTMHGLRVIGLIALALACAPGCAHRAAGQTPGIWELRGAVVDVTGDRLLIRHRTGQTVELVMDARTEVRHDDKPEGRDALRRGRRVRIVVEPQAGGVQLARTVRVYGG
jgi:hypothetical protein